MRIKDPAQSHCAFTGGRYSLSRAAASVQHTAGLKSSKLHIGHPPLSLQVVQGTCRCAAKQCQGISKNPLSTPGPWSSCHRQSQSACTAARARRDLPQTLGAPGAQVLRDRKAECAHLERVHVHGLAHGARQPQHNLLRGLCLLVEHRLGLAAIPRLLAVIPPLPCTHTPATTRPAISICSHRLPTHAASAPVSPHATSAALCPLSAPSSTHQSSHRLAILVIAAERGCQSNAKRIAGLSIAASARQQSRTSSSTDVRYSARSAAARSWLAPCAYRLALPVLYWVTLCTVCFLQFLSLQNARLVFGTFTCARARARL